MSYIFLQRTMFIHLCQNFAIPFENILNYLNVSSILAMIDTCNTFRFHILHNNANLLRKWAEYLIFYTIDYRWSNALSLFLSIIEENNTENITKMLEFLNEYQNSIVIATFQTAGQNEKFIQTCYQTLDSITFFWPYLCIKNANISWEVGEPRLDKIGENSTIFCYCLSNLMFDVCHFMIDNLCIDSLKSILAVDEETFHELFFYLRLYYRNNKNATEIEENMNNIKNKLTSKTKDFTLKVSHIRKKYIPIITIH